MITFRAVKGASVVGSQDHIKYSTHLGNLTKLHFDILKVQRDSDDRWTNRTPAADWRPSAGSTFLTRVDITVVFTVSAMSICLNYSPSPPASPG